MDKSTNRQTAAIPQNSVDGNELQVFPRPNLHLAIKLPSGLDSTSAHSPQSRRKIGSRLPPSTFRPRNHTSCNSFTSFSRRTCSFHQHGSLDFHTSDGSRNASRVSSHFPEICEDCRCMMPRRICLALEPSLAQHQPPRVESSRVDNRRI